MASMTRRHDESRSVLMCGSLWKQGGTLLLQGGQQRFFVLTGPKRPTLSYYLEEKHFKAGLPPKKVYDLDGCSLTCPGRVTKKASMFGLFHPVRGQVLLKCPCPIQCEWWMEALEGALTKKEVLSMSDFEVLMMVGKGSFGMVLQVRKKDSGSIYALKVLDKKHACADSEAVKFERKILEIVNHPFIVKLHYAFQTHGALCLVMDFVNGGELFAHLKREGKFSEDDSRVWSAEILLALEYLHTMGIIYRDLKPENVLLDPVGHVKLTDFGLARDERDKSSPFAVAGSAYYMAPEIVLMKGHGCQADWWSFGVLTYEMITGLPPFYEANARAGYQKLLTRPIEYPDHVSQNARKLINGLLCTDPDQRLGCVKQSVDRSQGQVASFPAEADGKHIKQQAWFRKLDFSKVLLKQVRPRMIRKPKDLLDTSNFDEVFTSDETWKNLPLMRDTSFHSGLCDGKKEEFGEDFNFKKTPFRRPRRYSLPDKPNLAEDLLLGAPAPISTRDLSGSLDCFDVQSPKYAYTQTVTSSGLATIAKQSVSQMRNVPMPMRPNISPAPWSLQISTVSLSLEVDAFRKRAINCKSFTCNPLIVCPTPKEGLLMKRARQISKKWRQRWVKLVPSLGCVMYFKDSTQLTPKGVFALPTPSNITCNEGMYTEGARVYVYSFTVQIKSGDYEFICETQSERDEWLYAMRASAARWKQSSDPLAQMTGMNATQKKKGMLAALNLSFLSMGPSIDNGHWQGLLADGSVVDMVAEVFHEKGGAGRYDGMVDCQGTWSGRGMVSLWDGTKKDGFWDKGVMGRLALIVYPSGDFYEGEWQAAGQGTLHAHAHVRDTSGMRAGYGAMFRANGDCYEGEWARDLEHGTGIAFYALGGEVCVGNYARGVRDGHGVLYYPNGTVYDGGWRSGKQSGVGMMHEVTEEEEEEEESAEPDGADRTKSDPSSLLSGGTPSHNSQRRASSGAAIHPAIRKGSTSSTGSFKKGIKRTKSWRCIDGEVIDNSLLEQSSHSTTNLQISIEDLDTAEDVKSLCTSPAHAYYEEDVPRFEDARASSNLSVSSFDEKECIKGFFEEWGSDAEGEDPISPSSRPSSSRVRRHSSNTADVLELSLTPEHGEGVPDEFPKAREISAPGRIQHKHKEVQSAAFKELFAPNSRSEDHLTTLALGPSAKSQPSSRDQSFKENPLLSAGMPPAASSESGTAHEHEEGDRPVQTLNLPSLKSTLLQSLSAKKKKSDYMTQSFDMSGDTNEWNDEEKSGSSQSRGSSRGNSQGGTPFTSPIDAVDHRASPLMRSAASDKEKLSSWESERSDRMAPTIPESEEDLRVEKWISCHNVSEEIA